MPPRRARPRKPSSDEAVDDLVAHDAPDDMIDRLERDIGDEEPAWLSEFVWPEDE